MNLGVQYYRAPFPNQRYWDDDFARIKASGLNCVQLWVLWGWVEPTPGDFRFDDYDRLVELADKHGLGVVLSTIAEIQPYWIHREVPGSEMIDHMGNRVISSNRGECHFGITPGGCTDHPGVWERMQEFLRQVVTRYAGAPNLRGWDAWNETRWNVNSDGLVCFCEHTLAAFHAWLDEKHGGLDGLNEAWIRRYGQWDEVMPGKLPHRPYSEIMAFEHFLTWRADQHAKARYEVMRPLDPHRPITVHGPAPCALMGGGKEDHALNRGNDWFFADYLDGVGCSSFPKWFNVDDADFGARVEFVKSAARGKETWLSEVQGGRSAIGFNVDAPVDALSQQRWVWNGIASGADTILFWCWRDEVFGRESAGFGLCGLDGCAEERLEAMATTGKLIEEYRDLINAYQPAKGEVGVLFSPQSYYLNWGEEGNSRRMTDALQAYCRSLVKRSIPYTVVEEAHLEALDGLKILFLPHTLVVDDHTAARLGDFVRNGGTLVCESECGAFNSAGLYRYPEDRFTATLTGVAEIGRRRLTRETVEVSLDGRMLTLPIVQWTTPLQTGTGTVLAAGEDGPLVVEVPVGKGKVVLCGAYLGEGYWKQRNDDFEQFVEMLARRAGCQPAVEVAAPRPQGESYIYLKYGESAGDRVVFAFFPPDCAEATLNYHGDFFPTGIATDLISGAQFALAGAGAGQQCTLPAPPWRFAVLVDEAVAARRRAAVASGV